MGLINNKPNPISSVRLSFWDCLQAVKEQIGYEEIGTDPMYQEICKIKMLNPAGEMKIDGEMKPVALVQEIFAQLTFDHVEMVAENFGRVRGRIMSTKAYMRTALYNSMFELEAHYTNLVQHDMAEGAGK